MILDPKEFIILGQTIINDNNYSLEVRNRTAIGRIYYGILHHIRLIKKLSHIDTEHFHTNLIEAIMNHDSILGNHLKSMKIFRTEADYYLNIKPNLDSFLKTYNRVQKRLDIMDVD